MLDHDEASLSGTAQRLPRILIAGEFSAGKSQLINALAGQKVVPSGVTATALPPVWLVGGAQGITRVDSNDQAKPVDRLTGAGVMSTKYFIRGSDAPLLASFDLIDTPGSSDPNMPADCWERMLGYADMVIWCTNAVQAWRQSEKAVWDEMPEHLVGTGMLLLTHLDKLHDTRSCDKLMRRVRREAGDYFGTICGASLIDPDHITELAAEIAAQAAALTVLPGAEAPAVDRARNPEPAAEQPADVQAVVPRRVKARHVPETAGHGNGVVPLFDPTTKAVAETDGLVDNYGATPKTPAATGGVATETWERLTRGHDLTRPDILNACIAQLLGELDGEFERMHWRQDTQLRSGPRG